MWKPLKKNADGSVFIDPVSHLPTTDPLGITDFFKEAPDVDEVPLVKGLSKGAASTPHTPPQSPNNTGMLQGMTTRSTAVVWMLSWTR